MAHSLTFWGGDILTTAYNEGTVQRWTTTGQALGSFGVGYLVHPVGIAVSDSGIVYVTDIAAGRVQVFHDGPLTQTIGFTSSSPSPARVGGGYTATATASSRLPVTFSVGAGTTAGRARSRPAGRCVFTGVGTCVVAADQAGNGGSPPRPPTRPSVDEARGHDPPSSTSAGPTTVDATGKSSGRTSRTRSQSPTMTAPRRP